MKGLKKILWLAASLVLIASLIVPGTLAVIEHIKSETAATGVIDETQQRVIDEIPQRVIDEIPQRVIDETQQSSDYKRGYQAGYHHGLQVAYQWMITKILEQMQMAGVQFDPLEGPKIKQAVDALSPQVGDLE